MICFRLAQTKLSEYPVRCECVQNPATVECGQIVEIQPGLDFNALPTYRFNVFTAGHIVSLLQAD